MAALGDKIFAVGGVGRGRRNTGATEEYEPAADRWVRRAPMPTPRDHLAAAVVEGKLYAIGGRVDGSYAKNLAVNEEYDPKRDRWRARAPMPTARSGIAAAALEARIFVFGGESPSGTFAVTESYEPATDRWRAWAPMPTARHGLGAAALGKRIYVLSGGALSGGKLLRGQRGLHALTVRARGGGLISSRSARAAALPRAAAPRSLRHGAHLDAQRLQHAIFARRGA